MKPIEHKMNKPFSILLLCLAGIILTAGVVDEESPVITADAVKITPSELGLKFYFPTQNKGYVLFDLKKKYSGTFTVEFKYRISPVAPVFRYYLSPEAKWGFLSQTFFIGDATRLHQDIDNYYKTLDNKSGVINNKSGETNIADMADTLNRWFYVMRDLYFTPASRGYGGLMPPLPPPPPKVTTIFADANTWNNGCNNYYKLHSCKWIIDFSRSIEGCAVDGFHSLSKYPIVVNGHEYFCFGFANLSGQPGTAIEISDVKIQQGVPPGDAVHDVEFPRKQFREYEKMASLKDPEAMYWLGLCYYEGSFGAPKDYFTAIEWFKKAAAQRHVFAQYYLGLCYHFGRGTEPDRQKACELFREGTRCYYSAAAVMFYWHYAMGWWKPPEFGGSRHISFSNNQNIRCTADDDIIFAASQGDANAIYLTRATFAMQGSASPRSIVSSGGACEISHERAAMRGNYKALYLVGEQYWNWPDRKNLPAKQAAARFDFELAAKQNYPPALFRLAQLWPAEYGGNLKQAADSGYAPAMVKYGMMLSTENKEADKALDYLIKADAAFSGARQKKTVGGDAELCLWKYVLKQENWQEQVKKWQSGKNAGELLLAGMALEHGWGITADKAAAYDLYRQVANSGYPPANYKLGQDCRYGITKPMNFNDAKYFMGKAAEAGFAPAQYELAQMCETSSDPQTAEKWYQKAAEQNHPSAIMRLGEKFIKSADVKNQQKGLPYLERAAALGEARAIYFTGLAYYKGLAGLKKDTVKASKLWTEYEKQEEDMLNREVIAPLWKKMPCCVPNESEFWDRHDPGHSYLFDSASQQINLFDPRLSRTKLQDSKPKYHSKLKRIYCGLENQDQVLEYFNKYFVPGIPADESGTKNIRINKK